MRIVIRVFVLTGLLICFTRRIAAADSPTTMPATMPTTAPVSINWDQAKDYIGQYVTVTGPVVGSHDLGKAVVLNIGKDYPAPDRFTVYLTAEKRVGFPDDLDKDKTISVTGMLKLFHNVAEIEGDPAHIVVIGQSSTAPATQP